MGELWIGIIIGSVVSSFFFKGEASLRHWRENYLLKLENRNLRGEREELKNKVAQNGFHINELKGIVGFHQDRIEYCLTCLSSISKIKNEVELRTHVIKMRSIRDKVGILSDDEGENDTYISK